MARNKKQPKPRVKSQPRRWQTHIPDRAKKYLYGFVTIVVGGIGVAIVTQGPKQTLAFPRQLAQDFPVLFWSSVALLTLPALAGLGFQAHDLLVLLRRNPLERDRYIRHLQHDYGFIPLVVDRDPSHTQDLPDFVFQTLTFVDHPFMDLADTREEGVHEARESVHVNDIREILGRRETRVIIILGDPGSGKTTFLRHSVKLAADRILPPTTDPQASIVPVTTTVAADSSSQRQMEILPIYIELRHFAPFLMPAKGQEPVDSWEALSNYLRAHDASGLREFATDLRDFTKRGEVLLFLDGLDEVDENAREVVLPWIRQLPVKLGGAKISGAIIIGTRFTDYDPHQFDALGPAEWRAEPMGPSDQYSLAVKLIPILTKQNAPHRAQKEPALEAQEFLKALDHHDLKHEWRGNPLLFSLAALAFSYSGTLPRSRVALYSRSVEALLAKTIQQSRQGGARKVWLLERVRDTLAQVALDFYDAKAFIEQDLNPTLRNVAVQLGLPGDDSNMLSQWVITSRLIKAVPSPHGPVSLTFIHLTFQEYLAAVAIANQLCATQTDAAQTIWKFIQERRFNEGWQQPMRMLVGVLIESSTDARPRGRQVARRWLEELLSIAHDPTQPDHDAALLLAVATLTEIPDLAGVEKYLDVTTVLRDWAETLLRAASTGQEKTLADFQRIGRELPQDARFMEPAIDRLLQPLRGDGQPEVQRAAAQVLAGLGALVPIDPLLAVLRRQGNDEVRIAIAQALITLGATAQGSADAEHAPESAAHAALRAMLANDDAGMCIIVATALGGAGENGRELMLAAIQHQDAQVRRLAVVALGSLGDHLPVNALRRALRDADSFVQGAAINVLAGSAHLPDSMWKDLAVDGIEPLIQDLTEPARTTIALSILTAWERGLQQPRARALVRQLTARTDAPWQLWQARAGLEDDFILRLDAIATIAAQAAPESALAEAAQVVVPTTLRRLRFSGAWLRQRVAIIPPLVEIPAGPFMMGSSKRRDKEAEVDEYLHEVTLVAYAIGVYPVTVAEYVCAVKAGAVREPPESGGVDWSKQLMRLDHPVVCVAWRDAMAYLDWLRATTGDSGWRLPTEAEWEKAARWDARTRTARIYPWGDTGDKTKANTNDGGPGTTTPVGAYAERGDVSPYGCHDMAGNVWEWTSSIYDASAYQSDNKREINSDRTAIRVLRGGSWNNYSRLARAAVRYRGSADIYFSNCGFRLVRGVGAGSH